MMLLLLAGLAAAPEITAFKVNTLPYYDEQGVQTGTLTKAELPALPLEIKATNEFGYLEVRMKMGNVDKDVYLRPADVRHDLVYCSGEEEVRRDTNERLAGARPGGVRKGAAENGRICIPK